MHTVNKAFTQKPRFLLITDTNALWMKFLGQKYRIIDTCSTSIARSNNSSLWRALSNGWNDLLSSIARSVDNGNSICLFNDAWVSSLSPLRDHVLHPIK
ncbi:hypothetical protein V6N12_051716 [Hibiscus sabdariffa]|uniref:Uncharacterized protein n=1 Tax=Hibiscus sabdariffa TaxID=183260 RepID=A0ABR2GG62_9ROSI